MRVAIFSDIHGNLIALDAIIADLSRQSPFDQIIVAGDLAWSGPWPAEVVDRVRALGAVVIQGNTDAFFGRPPDGTPPARHETRFAEHLNWMLEQLGPQRATYLATLPFSHRISPAPGHDLLVVHANPFDQEVALTRTMSDADLDELLMPEGVEPDWHALAFGHAHVPFTRYWRGRLLVNVASAGLPMDGDPRAAYAVLTWDGLRWQAKHNRVFYDAPVVAHQMSTCGLPRGKYFAERLMAAGYSVTMQAVVAMSE